MKIENISNEIQIISGMPAFLSQEVREVDQEVGERLLKNPNFRIVEEKSTKKTSKKEVIL